MLIDISFTILVMDIAYFNYAFAVDVLYISFGSSSKGDGCFIPERRGNTNVIV